MLSLKGQLKLFVRLQIFITKGMHTLNYIIGSVSLGTFAMLHKKRGGAWYA